MAALGNSTNTSESVRCCSSSSSSLFTICGLGCGDVVALARVGLKVVQFQVAVALEHLATNPLVVSPSDRLLPAVSRELPVQHVVRGLAPDSGECREHADAVCTCWWSDARDLADGREHVPRGAHVVCHLSRGDSSGPAGDEWHPNTAFVDRTLAAAEWTRRLKEVGIRATEPIESRPVVAREAHERLLRQAEFIDEIENPANIAIHVRDHRRVAGPRRRVLKIAAMLIRSFGNPALVFGQRRGRNLDREMRHGVRHVEKKRFFLMIANERQRLLGKPILRIRFASQRAIVSGQHLLDMVPPQEPRVVVVGMHLAVKAVEQVEALAIGISARAEVPKSPFADRGRRIARFLQ